MELLSIKEITSGFQDVSIIIGILVLIMTIITSIVWDTYCDKEKKKKYIIVTILILIFVLNIFVFNTVLESNLQYKYYVTDVDEVQTLIDDGYRIYNVNDNIYELNIKISD